MLRYLVVTLVFAALAGCTPTAPTLGANVVIVRSTCYTTYSTFREIIVKNTGGSTAYYVTVGGTATDPAHVAPGAEARAQQNGTCSGGNDVSWSNNP